VDACVPILEFKEKIIVPQHNVQYDFVNISSLNHECHPKPWYVQFETHISFKIETYAIKTYMTIHVNGHENQQAGIELDVNHWDIL
jgi:hypothetical protein